MDDDDRPVGRVLTRREVLALLGTTGVLWVTRCSGSGSTTLSGNDAVPSGCVVRPELTEGPYYVDEALNRSDIRSDPATGLGKAGTFSI